MTFTRQDFLTFQSALPRPVLLGELDWYRRAGSDYGRASLIFEPVPDVEIVLRVGVQRMNEPTLMLWSDQICFSRLDVNASHLERGELWTETHLHERQGESANETATREFGDHPPPPMPGDGDVAPHIYGQVFEWFARRWTIDIDGFDPTSAHYSGGAQ